MSVPTNLHALTGTWTGVYRLHLPGEPLRESATTAEVDLAAQARFVTIDYTWEFDGQPQDGLLVFGRDPEQDAVGLVWIDSWHMRDRLMLCQGHIEANQDVVVHGSYQVVDGPDWGWRTVIRAQGDAWHMVMYNVSPDDHEVLAVEAEYARRSQD